MRKPVLSIYVLTLFALAMGVHAQSIGSAGTSDGSALASEKNVDKIQQLILSTDYGTISEDTYVGIITNLTSLAKSTDFTTDAGRADAARLYMALINFTYCFQQGSASSLTKDMQTKQSDDMFKSLKAGVTKEQYVASLSEDFPSDASALRESYRKTVTTAK